MIQITVTGNLGRQATTKTLPNGRTITTFTLASTPRFKKDNEWVDGETVWFTVTGNGSYPEALLDRGAQVIVSGDLQQKSYTDKEGKERSGLFISATTIGNVIRRLATDSTPYHTPPATNATSTGWNSASWATTEPAELDDTPF